MVTPQQSQSGMTSWGTTHTHTHTHTRKFLGASDTHTHTHTHRSFPILGSSEDTLSSVEVAPPRLPPSGLRKAPFLPWPPPNPTCPSGTCIQGSSDPGPPDREPDPVVFSRLFVPERPPQSDGHRGGIPESGVSISGGIHKQFQILVQIPMCVIVEDGGDHSVRERSEEGPRVHQRPSCTPHLHSDLGEPQRRGCGNVLVWD